MIEGNGAGTCDSEPEEQRKVFKFVESQQGLEGIDIAPFGGLDGHDHRHGQGSGRYAREQSQQKEQSANEFDTGGQGREKVWKGDSPADEILSHLGKIVELAPAAEEKYPAHRDSCKQRRQPQQMPANTLRPGNQPIDQ